MGNQGSKPDEPIDVDILIIGAGATGLGAAYRLNQLGLESWALVDVNGNPGGSAGSIKTAEGFRFDIGQHNIPIKSDYEYFETLKAKTRGHKLSPKTRQFTINDQSNADNINTYFNVASNLGRVAAAANVIAGETTFDQFLIEKFGEKNVAASHRALYNKKFSFPTSLISGSAAENLITTPTEIPDQESENVADLPDSFLYPQEGGQSNFWKAIAKSLPSDNLRFKTEVVAINLEEGVAETKNGGTINFKYIVSTMAINKLLDITSVTEEEPEEGAEVPAQQIKPTVVAPTAGTAYVNLGIRGKLPEFAIAGSTDVADSNICFHQMNFASKFDNSSAPEKSELLSTIRRVDNKELKESQMEPKKGPYWSVQFEISSGVLNPLENSGSPDFIEQVINDAVHLGVLKGKDNIVSLKVSQYQNNLAIPIIGNRDNLNAGLEWLKNHKVWSRGALGSQAVLNNSDDCFMIGVQAIDNLLFDDVEFVLNGDRSQTAFEVDGEREIKREDIKRPGEEEEEEEDEPEEDEEDDDEEESDEEESDEDDEDSEDSSIVVVKGKKKSSKKVVAKKSKGKPAPKPSKKPTKAAKKQKSKPSKKWFRKSSSVFVDVSSHCCMLSYHI